MPVMPSSIEIASYRTHAEAQAAVDLLSDEKFDVKSIMVIDTNLYLAERVIGQLTMTKAALSGASSDALWGAFMGLMMSFASTNQPTFLWVLLDTAGSALMGTFMSGLLYAMTDGRGDFTSQSRVVASCYVALTSAGVDQAFEFLQRNPDNQTCPRPARRRFGSKGSSEYGSRPDEKPRFDVRLSNEGEDGGAEVPRDSEHAVPAQKPTETAVRPAKDSRRSLD